MYDLSEFPHVPFPQFEAGSNFLVRSGEKLREDFRETTFKCEQMVRENAIKMYNLNHLVMNAFIILLANL